MTKTVKNINEVKENPKLKLIGIIIKKYPMKYSFGSIRKLNVNIA